MFRALSGGCFQTIKKEIPMMMYRVVQTGANNQLGGLKEGLFRDVYHSGIASAVNAPAIAPIANGMASESTSLMILAMRMCFSFSTLPLSNNCVKKMFQDSLSESIVIAKTCGFAENLKTFRRSRTSSRCECS
jgi:hypothetical protein